MGTRSRKRRRGEAAAVDAAAATASPAAAPRAAPEQASPSETMRRGYARGRERDEAIRQSLVPLAPGERPQAVTVAAIVALIFAIANIAAALGGADLSSEENNPTTVTAVTTAILLLAAYGMWRARYWAVLGFQIILALQIIAGSLALIRVEKWWIAVGLTVLLGLLGWLFWKLVRAMARLQMPAATPREAGGKADARRKRDVMTTQRRQTRAGWKLLQAHGVSAESELAIEFFFEAPGDEEARALVAFLDEATDYTLTVDADGERWTVTGATSPMPVSEPRLDRWVRFMVAIGFEHDCEFGGWGAQGVDPGREQPTR